MARKFRFEGLPKEAADKFGELFSSWDANSQDKIKEFIDKGDTKGLTDYITPRINAQSPDKLQSILGDVNNIVSKLPSARDAYQKHLDSVSPDKEADLTDQELKDRQEAFRGLSQSGGSVYDPAKISTAIESQLFKFDMGASDSRNTGFNKTIREKLTDFVVKNQRLPNAGDEAQGLGLYNLKNPDTLNNFLNDQDNKNFIAGVVSEQVNPPAGEDHVKRIQDILTDRGRVATNDKLYESTLAELPGELAAGRANFLAEREGQAQKFLAERVGPRAVATLNASGLAEGPDVGSLVASQAQRMQSGIEDTLRSIAADDSTFFADAAFRLHTARLDQSESDFRSSVAAERLGVRNDQENRFKSGERDTQRQFELTMLEREGQRNLDLGQNTLSIGRDRSNSDLMTGLVSETAQNTAQVVAGKLTYGNTGKKQQPSPSFKTIG